MIRVNNGTGQTQDDPIVILEAKDDREGWIYIEKYIEYIMEYNRYDCYLCDDVIDTLDLELRKYRFFKYKRQVAELWIDWTMLFHVWDK